ncbi:hypothetical protein [Aciditerrimonas ferrireducens]|jgi:hypothetical protein|uniref:hypothetical protein n=1 Tax=Aciditerrimonas ferrireducens TaxID=667306 RepID=UPI0020041850|nr:hypothetical protein [Aciditerrimonas ferrireducens]MCK4176260.1 hypothetical protein [Aciditerrimonas ferrireducens]
MLDHILVELISQLRSALEGSLLQRQAIEERFQVDVFLGDVSWETSYSLPGEDQPPRVRADVSLDWPTWSQSLYRSWSIGEPAEEAPEVLLELTIRQQRLAARPDLDAVLATLPSESPELAGDRLVRSAPVVEEVLGTDEPSQWAVETTYQGSVVLDEATLEDPSRLAAGVGELATWVASLLVRVADLDFPYLPPEPEPDEAP